MKFEIKRFDILRAGVIAAIMYSLLAVLMLPFAILACVTGREDGTTGLIAVLLYPLLGFFGGILGAGFYNLASRMCGGIKFELVSDSADEDKRDEEF